MIYDDFEMHFKRMLHELREKVASDTTENAIKFSIIAEGRVNDGELNITFKLEQQFASEFDTSGGYLGAVVYEFCRRAGWQSINKSTCLPSVKPPPAPRPASVKHTSMDDEIPF